MRRRRSALSSSVASLYSDAAFVADFINNYYSVDSFTTNNPQLIPGLSFSRNSTGYAEDSAGNLRLFPANTPRITDKGLLIEESRTNVLLQSTTLSNFGVLNATNTTDGTLSLTGNLARKVTSLTAAATSFNYNIAGGAAAGANTVSVYAKRGSGSTDANTFALRNATTATTLVSIVVNYDTGVFSYSAGSSGAVVTPMANGWWRISLTSSSFSAGDGLQLYAAFQGNTEAAGEYAYLADAQGEAGSFATSYIPTAGSSVTRAADDMFVTKNINQISSMYAEAMMPAADPTTDKHILTLSVGTDINNRRAFVRDTSSAGLGTSAQNYSGGPAVGVSTSPSTYRNIIRTAQTFNGITYTHFLNGFSPNGSLSGTAVVGQLSRISIGARPDSTLYFNSYIRAVAVFNRALTQSEAAVMTSGIDPSSLFLDFANGIYKNNFGYTRTNLILQSQGMNTLPWSSISSATVALVSGAPDGTATMARVTGGGITSSRIQQSVSSIATNSVYAGSFYISYDTASVSRVAMFDGGVGTQIAAVTINWTAGIPSLGTINGTFAIAPSLVQLNSTTWRVCFAINSGAFTSLAMLLYPDYVSGTGSTKFWGAQLELGSYPTSYIPTVTTATSTLTYTSMNPSDVAGMAFTRSSVGYAEDLAGNLISFSDGVPRITNRGVLIEETRTNLLLRSQEFDNAVWSKGNSTVSANTALAPDGTLTADTFYETVVNTQHYVNQDVIKSASAIQYTFSGYISQVGIPRNVKLTMSSGGSNGVDFIFNPATLTVVSGPSYYGVSPFTGAYITLQSAANGFVRFAMTATTNTDTTIRALSQSAQGTTLSFAGDTSTGFNQWGYQLEAASFATSYIPTTTAAASRSPDVFYYTGISLPQNSTFASEIITPSTTSNFPTVFYLNDGTTNNQIIQYFNNSSGSTALGVDVSGSSIIGSGIFPGSFTLGSKGVFTARISSGVYGAAVNGGAVSTNAGVGLPIVSRFVIGGKSTGANQLNGYLQRIAIYPYSALDNELVYRSIAYRTFFNLLLDSGSNLLQEDLSFTKLEGYTA